jgi:hypothetical protein
MRRRNTGLYFYWKFGGAQAVQIGHQVLGLLSMSTIPHQSLLPLLQVSAKYPISEEVDENITEMFPPTISSLYPENTGMSC